MVVCERRPHSRPREADLQRGRREATAEQGIVIELEISKENNPKTFADNAAIAQKGGDIAGNTRKQIEAQTGKKIVTTLNAKALKAAKQNKKLE